jgi:putative ABC transport system permease protein
MSHTKSMIRIALKDLQWRTRRVVIAVLGASVVLALALVMSGLSAGFENESARTVGLARATGWVLDSGGTGPFLQPSPLNAEKVSAIVDQVGKAHAAPILFGRQSVLDRKGKRIGSHEHVNLVGAEPMRLGSPMVHDGKGLSGTGQAVVDETLGLKIGDPVVLGGKIFDIVGTVRGARLLAGVPNAYISLSDAQQLAFGGRNLATAVVVDRTIIAPSGTKVLSNAEAKVDGLRPVVNAQKTIGLVRSLLWLVAALIVGSVIYLSALERSKDFAVLKGMGAKSASLVGSLAVQAAVLGLTSALLGSGLAVVLAPLFPLQAEIPLSAFLLLPLVAVTIGLLASVGAAKRMFSIQPALAFGS